MLDPKTIEDMAKRLTKALPKSVQDLESDLRKKFSEILQATFAKLDLVTREEFDTQVKVLARTREKLDNLEKAISKLEKNK